LWVLNTGAQWHMLPQSYPNYKSVHRFQTWGRDEVLRRVLMDLANELRDNGALDEAECFIDATFVTAKGDGALLCLVSMAAPHPRPLGILRKNFLGFVQLACLVFLFRRF
jgi:transposase